VSATARGLLQVNNNNSVDFRFRIGTLDKPDDDRLAAATRWSGGTKHGRPAMA
jgi:hypothetical protein